MAKKIGEELFATVYAILVINDLLHLFPNVDETHPTSIAETPGETRNRTRPGSCANWSSRPGGFSHDTAFSHNTVLSFPIPKKYFTSP